MSKKGMACIFVMSSAVAALAMIGLTVRSIRAADEIKVDYHLWHYDADDEYGHRIILHRSQEVRLVSAKGGLHFYYWLSPERRMFESPDTMRRGVTWRRYSANDYPWCYWLCLSVGGGVYFAEMPTGALALLFSVPSIWWLVKRKFVYKRGFLVRFNRPPHSEFTQIV